MNGEGTSSRSDFRTVLTNDESLAHFLSAMRDFDKAFCDAMVAGVDFTLKLEVHGNRGEMIHARVQADAFRRPSGVEKRVDGKRVGNSV